MPKKDDIINPIDADFEEVTEAVANPRTKNPSQNKVLIPPSTLKPRTPGQGELDLHIQKQIEIDGVGMGVLSDGTPFLTGRGLARLCGVDSSRISEMAADWNSSSPKPMAAKVKQILQERGLPVLIIPTSRSR